MPPNAAERRPVAGTGVQSDARGGISTMVAVTPFRRRRAASWRRPPLASGHRDPLDGLAGVPVRAVRCARAVLGTNGVWRACCRGDGA